MIFHDWSLLPQPAQYDPVLNNNTWEQIAKASDEGIASTLWKVGDRKEVVLNGTVGILTFEDYHTYAYIIGFDHNAAVEGDHRIHFQLAMSALEGGQNICFVDSNYNTVGSSAGFRMNTSNTNSGGWGDSYMRRNICGQHKTGIVADTLMFALPDDLIYAIKGVTKYTDNTGNNSTTPDAVTATTDYIFLLSEYEVFGICDFSNTNEASRQQQYAYYATGNGKVKYLYNSSGTSARWWVRSPDRRNNNYFCCVFDKGNANINAAYVSRGFAPCFCV